MWICSRGITLPSKEYADAQHNHNRRGKARDQGGLDFFILRGWSDRRAAGDGHLHHLLGLDGIQELRRALEPILRLHGKTFQNGLV